MNIRQIKEKYTCLDWLGDRVVRKTNNGYLARCPWREDRHPSMTITANGRGWHDMKDGSHGNLIEMVMRCLNTDKLSDVCAAFDTMNLSSFHPSKIIDEGKEKENEYAFFDIVPLQSRGLFAYLWERCIDIAIAKRFLSEAHYGFKVRDDGKYLYALAYPNDKGGYELRGKPYKGNKEGFKGSTSPKWITTHLNFENAPTIVFEGFMDMLSFATMCGEVRNNYIVLNSIVHVDAAIEVLKHQPGKIMLCLDNDNGGNDATIRMLSSLPSAIDIRNRFAPSKDVNAYLINLKNKQTIKPTTK